jgi:hypothetical protein
MKNHFSILVSTIICLGLLPAYSQSGPPGGPQLGGTLSKLFGDNQTFSADLEMQVSDKSGKPMTMPGKLSFDTGKSRFEISTNQMVTIARPDKKIAYLVYPGLRSYAEIPLSNADSAPTKRDYKMEITEIGADIVDGHPCVKNKYIVTDNEGVKHESTVWNATDLKKFPVKIETVEQGDNVSMLFQNVSLAKPAASLFDPPADFKKYDTAQQMQQEMMKRLGGDPGMTPH